MNSNPQIFIINLKKDVAKKEHMKALCKDNFLQCVFIDAIYGADLDKQFIKKIVDQETAFIKYGRELSHGEIGCAMSHASIYQKMIENDIENAIILEDDIHLDKNFSTLLKLIDKFPKDWELMLLGYHSQEFGLPKKVQTKASFRYKLHLEESFKVVRLAQLAYGTYGYMINKNGAQKLLNVLTPITRPIDHYTGVDTYINMYAIQPRVVFPVENSKENSNISSEREILNQQITFKRTMAKILYKFGLLKIIKNAITFYKRCKKLKEYH